MQSSNEIDFKTWKSWKLKYIKESGEGSKEYEKVGPDQRCGGIKNHNRRSQSQMILIM